MTTFSWHHRHTGGRPAGERAGTAPDAPDAAATPTAEPFWQVLSLGLVTVLFGIAVLAWPDRTLHLLGILAGVWLIVLGATRAVAAFDRKQGSSQRIFAGVMAAVLVAAGIACVRNATSGVLVLAALIGLAWLLSGMAELAIGLLATGSTRVGLSLLGGISILVGLAFMLWPGPSLTTLVLLTGISALLIGAGEVAFALQLRRGRKAIEPAHP